MTALADRVLVAIQAHRMVPAGGRVLVALSGGSDSVALTALLREVAARGHFTLAGLAHLNHALRSDADADEEFCRALAAELQLPFRSAREDVRERAAGERRSIEDAARRARYAFLARIRAELGADVVATGHTRDDQAETFLLRLVRGAGSRGLAGIHPVAGRVVRPLLDLSRAELRDYLRARHQPWREDATNADRSIPRNRIRHELLPLLARFNPAIVDALATAAALARDDDEALRAKAIDSAGLIVLRSTSGHVERLTPAVARRLDSRDPLPEAGGAPAPELAGLAAVELDAAGLAALPRAVALRVVQVALSVLAPGRLARFDHIDRVLALAAGSGRPVSVAGAHARRERGAVVLEPRPIRGFENRFEVLLSIPGEVVIAGAGWAIAVGRREGAADIEVDTDGLAAAVQASTVQLPLTVRSRRPGDRLRLLGMGGRSRKLQDVLVDRKIPRASRDRLPLVVDASGRIVWVVGGPPCEDFRVTAPAQGVILLKARRLGGPG